MSIFHTIIKHKKQASNSTLTSYRPMSRVAKFEKVSYEQYKNDVLKLFPNSPEDEIEKSYAGIILPTRATKGSAGYDIHATTSFALSAGDAITIPTGLRCKIVDGWVMLIAPRSGLGFKWYTRLANTLGVVDSDYYTAKNEGHIMVKIRRESDAGDLRNFALDMGDAISQAIFVPFGITEDDAAEGERLGGFGSTGK